MKKVLFAFILGCGVAAAAFAEIVNPEKYGFSPDASAETNAVALQRALDGGKRTVEVTKAGVYGIDRTLWLDNDTRLRFGPGVVLEKRGAFRNTLVNRGAPDRTWNTNIWVEGLTLRVNNVAKDVDESSPLFGQGGEVNFSYVRNVTVRDYKCLDLHAHTYGILFGPFENVVLDGFEIRGKKDGVHINAGRKFVIRNGILETGDDGIALNAEDWVRSAPVEGDIEDGLIENVTDEGHGECNFCRILTGAWTDWHKGIRLQRGDTVRCGKNLYRVFMPLGTKEYVSLEEPSHTKGFWKDKSGLNFWHEQSNGILSANIRNVTFRSIYLRSPRNQFLANWETSSEWNRGIHPEVKKENYPVCEVSLEDIYSESPLPLFYGDQSVTVWLRNVTKTRGALLSMGRSGCDIQVKMVLDGVVLRQDGGKDPDIRLLGAGCSLDLTVNGLMQERDLRLDIGQGVKARVNGIGSISSLQGITPVAGDSVKVQGVQKTFNGKEWR